MTKKPVKKNRSYYDYNEVAAYLEGKHGKNFRDYNNKFGKNGSLDNEYLDFWHYLLKSNDVSNGSFIRLPYLTGDHPEWVTEILGYFKEFLGDDYDNEIYVWW